MYRVLEIGMLTDSTTCLTTVSYHSIWGTHRCRLHSRSFRHTEIPGVHRFRRHTYADPEGSHEWWCLHLEIVSYNITLLKSWYSNLKSNFQEAQYIMCRLLVSKCYTCISNAKEKEQINVPPPLTMYWIFWHTCISFIYIALSICQNIQFYRYMYVRLSTTTTKHSAKTTNIRFIDKFENRQCEKSWKLVICKYTVYSYMVKDVQVNK